MATELLSFGPPTTLIQNIVYALPTKKAKLYTNTAAAVFQQSNDFAFATSSAVTQIEGAYEVSAAFIRVTNVGGALVTLKAA